MNEKTRLIAGELSVAAREADDAANWVANAERRHNNTAEDLKAARESELQALSKLSRLEHDLAKAVASK